MGLLAPGAVGLKFWRPYADQPLEVIDSGISSAVGTAAGSTNIAVYNKNLPGLSAENFQNLTLVSVVPASNLVAASGSIARIVVSFGTGTAGLSIPIYFGQAAAAGDAYDFLNTPTPVLFSGADFVTVAASTKFTSDWFTLPEPFDPSKNYCVAGNFPNIFISVYNTAATGHAGYTKSGADAATVNKTGYAQVYTDVASLVHKVEIQPVAVGAVAATPTYVVVSWAQAVATDAVGGATSATATAAATGAATATGAYTAARDVVAAGTSTATATGAFVAQRTVTAAGTSTAQATGAYTASRAVTVAGTGTAAATGTVIQPVAVTAPGVGAATATGQSFFAATANAAGASTAQAFGGQVGVSLGYAPGQGAAAATGSSTAAGRMVAAATSTAQATGQRIVFSAAAVSATATSTAQATGRAFVASAANAAGSGAATATSRTTVAGVATAAALGSAQAGGQWIIAAVAAAIGIGQAQAVGLVSTGNIKTQYLTGKRTRQPSVTGSDQLYAVTGQRSRPSVTGTKLPPAIIAQRKAPATWIAKQ